MDRISNKQERSQIVNPPIVSIRIPQEIGEKLNIFSQIYGFRRTEIILIALEQFLNARVCVCCNTYNPPGVEECCNCHHKLFPNEEIIAAMERLSSKKVAEAGLPAGENGGFKSIYTPRILLERDGTYTYRLDYSVETPGGKRLTDDNPADDRLTFSGEELIKELECPSTDEQS